ncbi:sugar ABC transporter permease [Microbacterium sp. LTA6]|uniref:carbohydrate ABC transporter permease n=1 Tax=unclassified Microbacterium TaxID=2609290 RepID=UPI00324A21E3
MSLPRSGRRTRGGVAWLYLAPAAAFYLAFVIYPYVNSLWYSFFEWNGVGLATWVGLENYVRVFTEPEQFAALLNAVLLIFFFTVLPITFALILAAVFARRRHSWGAVRAIVFLPQIVPLVAVGVAWRWIYSEDGLLNQALETVGLGVFARAWLGDYTWAFPAVGLVGTWVSTGLCLVLLLSGIQKIDPGLYEAVRLDGGGAITEFFTVTLPQLRGEIAVAATLTVISALASFDVVYIMTRGGPGTQTMVPGVEIYNQAFTNGRVGQASALAIVLSLLVYLVVILINGLVREKK